MIGFLAIAAGAMKFMKKTRPRGRQSPRRHGVPPGQSFIVTPVTWTSCDRAEHLDAGGGGYVTCKAGFWHANVRRSVNVIRKLILDCSEDPE